MDRPAMGASRFPKVTRRTWLLAVLACIAVFLFTDKSKDTLCIHNVFIYDVIVLPHNCDALSLADRLLQAQTFYTEFHNWKGRPVYHAYGMVAGHALVPVAFPLWAALYPGARAKNQLRKFSVAFNFHLAYFLLNIGVVVACVWVAIRISGVAIASWPAVGLAAAIASTDLVEGGVWLLHTNIFNLVSAFGTLLFVVLGMQRTIIGRGAVLAGGFLIGLGALVYPAIAIAAPGYVCGRAIGRFRVENDRRSLMEEALELLAFAAVAAAPVIAWWGANRLFFETGTYLTVDKGHFSWAPLAFKEGKLVEQIAAHWEWFFGLLMKFSAAEYLLGLGSILLLSLRGGLAGLKDLATDPVVWAALIAMAGVLSFNFLQGYHAARLMVAAAYLPYVIVARLSRSESRRTIGTACLFVIAGYQMVDALTSVTVTGD